MELKEIEREVHEQDEQSADLVYEVEAHRQQVERLEVAVTTLLEAQLAVDSDGIRRALDHASEAKFSSRMRLDDLREERNDLLDQNTALYKLCQDGIEKKIEARSKLPDLVWGKQSGVYPGSPSGHIYGDIDATLGEGIDRLASASARLQAVRTRLENLKV